MESEFGIPFDIWTICALGDTELLEEIIKSRTCKENVCKKNHESWTPLMYACHNKHKDIVSLLVKAGAPIDHVNNKRQTALMLACTTSDLTIVQSVFHKKIVDKLDNEGYTALYYAIEYTNQDIVEFLLIHGADPNLRCQGLTPLMHAAKIGNVNTIKTLLNHGANKYTVNSDNQMAIDIASKHGHIKAAYCLMCRQHVKNVQQLLQSINLERYWPLFEKNNITISTFINLSEDDFKNMGVKLFGHRRRMTVAIAELKKHTKPKNM